MNRRSEPRLSTRFSRSTTPASATSISPERPSRATVSSERPRTLSSRPSTITRQESSSTAIRSTCESAPTVDAGAYEYRGSGTASVTPAYVVTTLDDSFDPSDGATSLREAVYYANDPSKTITFASKLSGTVTLKAQLVAAADIRIDGGGRVALDAQNQSRVILAEAPLTLAGITLVNGASTENGGVIYAKDALTVANSTVSGGACGAAGFGGLIYAAGDFTAANSEFAQTAAGDALYLLGTSAITNSSVHNAAKDGIYSAGALTLVGTDVYANAGRGAVNDYGTVALTDSKLYENTGAERRGRLGDLYGVRPRERQRYTRQ